MAGILRYQLFLSIGIIFLSAWKASLSRLDSIKSWPPLSTTLGMSESSIEILVTYLPIWAIIALGLYALSCVLYRVATMGDFPEAAEELSAQILEAKEKLKAAGYSTF